MTYYDKHVSSQKCNFFVVYDNTIRYLISTQLLICHCGNPLIYKRRPMATVEIIRDPYVSIHA